MEPSASKFQRYVSDPSLGVELEASKVTEVPTLMFLLGLKLNTARTSSVALSEPSSKMHPVSDVHSISPTTIRVREWVPMVVGGYSLIKRASSGCGSQKENKLVCLFPAIKSLASHPKASVIRPTAAANRSA